MKTSEFGDAATLADIRLSLIGYATEITRSYVESNQLPAAELPNLVSSIHAAIMGIYSNGATNAGTTPAVAKQPAVKKATPQQISASISQDYLISFENGVGYKSLKQHLKNSGLNLEQYKEKWGLPADYPSCSASYSERRSEIARSTGLGGQKHMGQARRAAA